MSKRSHYVSEPVAIRQKAIIISDQSSPFEKHLKQYLLKHDIDVFISPKAPNEDIFQFCFIIISPETLQTIPSLPHKKNTYVLFDPEKRTLKKTSLPPQAKIIRILGDEHYGVSQIEHIVWFALSSRSHNRILTLESTAPPQKPVTSSKKNSLRIKYRFPVRLFITFFCISVFLFCISFLFPLALSSLSALRAIQTIQKRSYSEAYEYIQFQEKTLGFAESLYQPVRPLFLLFSLSRIPDDIFFTNKLIGKGILTGKSLQNDMKLLTDLILRPNKSPTQLVLTQKTFDKTILELTNIEETVVLFSQKIPSSFLSQKQKEKLSSFIAQIRKLKKAYVFLPEVLGVYKKQKILLLFANNMELRPGGGFIGSYGILNTSKFGLETLDVFDVYDADEQLNAHVDPPFPIRMYLNQPHWFLRDSAFFPDFIDTYRQASFFLEKEIGQTNWDGCILITTSAVKDILGAFSSLTLPDYKETITKDNFYIKTQYFAERSFFPGSTQKKSFLSALVRQLFIDINTADPATLSTSLVNALDTKNIVAYMEDDRLQTLLNNYYWSGRMANPFCTDKKQNCLSDYQFVLDANLGVNKANFFIDKTYSIDITIDRAYFINSSISLVYKNNSLSDVFPGGTYTNYVQVILPAQALITSVMIDESRIDSYRSEISDQHKIIGFLLHILPQESRKVTVAYQLPTSLKNGKTSYQLIIQKQIGAAPSDLSLTLHLPETIKLSNQNFSPLVKQNQIIYNTDLSTDRVFFIELLKE